jgi:hypothetical protein
MNITKYFARVNQTMAHGHVNEAQARDLLDAAKAASTSSSPADQAKLRAFLASSLGAHLDAFTPEAQKLFDGFINPAGVDPIADGLQVGANQPANMQEWTSYSRYAAEYGKLFVKGPSGYDLKQGQAGDCYFDASIASVAWNHPADTRQLVQPNRDGTVTVTFHQPNPDGTFSPVKITVDRSVPGWAAEALDPSAVSTYAGKPLYDTSQSATELWPALVEKAYAQWKGSYDTIGHGGMPANALGEVTGKPVTTIATADLPADQLFAQLSAASAAKHPIVCYTHCDGSHAEDFAATCTTNGETNVVPAHAYSLLRTTVENGQRFVVLRNPWGQQEPGADGRNDGVFKFPFDQFLKLYPSVSFTSLAPAPAPAPA